MLLSHGPAADGPGKRRRRRGTPADPSVNGDFPLTVAGFDDEWEHAPAADDAPDGEVPWWLGVDEDQGDEGAPSVRAAARRPRRGRRSRRNDGTVLDRYAAVFDAPEAADAAGAEVAEGPADGPGPDDDAIEMDPSGATDGGMGTGGDGDGKTTRFVFLEAATRYATDQPIDEADDEDVDAGPADDGDGEWGDDLHPPTPVPPGGRRSRPRRRAVLAGVPMVLVAAVGAGWAATSSGPDRPGAEMRAAAPSRAATTTTTTLFSFDPGFTLDPAATTAPTTDPAAGGPSVATTTTTAARTPTTVRRPTTTTTTTTAAPPTTTTAPPAVTTTAPPVVTTTTTRAPTTTTTRAPTTTTTTTPPTTTTTTTGAPTTTTTAAGATG